MRRTIPLLIFFLCASLTYARKDLVVTDASGIEIAHTISNDTRLHANGSLLELAESDNLLASVDCAQPVTIKLKEVSGIAMPGSQELSVVKTGTVLQCAGLRQPAVMQIYSITGAVCLKATVENGGCVSIESLAPGLYFVKVNDTTIKIRR